MAKKRTTKKKVALATARKRASADVPTAAPVAAPPPSDEAVPAAPTELAPLEQTRQPESPPAEQRDHSADVEIWGELNQHIGDIERNLGELRESLRAHDLIEAIEPVLMEIKNDVEAGRAKSELTAVGLDQIREDLGELHSQLVAVGRVGLRTEAQVEDLVGRLDAPEPEAIPEPAYLPTIPIWERPPTLLAGCAAVLVFSTAVYFQTGNFKLALGVLVSANLAGCAAVLIARKL